jgi:hypothetical protein
LISKDALLAEIRDAAQGKALAAGGNDADFDKAWQLSLPGLSVRYDNEIEQPGPAPLAAPAAPVLLDVREVFAAPRAVYLFAAVEGFAACFMGKNDAVYNALKQIGEATFGRSQDYDTPTAWRWTKDGLPGGRGGFVVIDRRASRGLNIMPAPLDAITPDLEVFRKALADALPQNSVELLGSKEQPLRAIPNLRPESQKPETSTLPGAVPDEDTAQPILLSNGTRTTPISREEADARIASLEAKYAAKLPSGLSEYQKAVMYALLCGSGNVFVEAVAGSGKSTTLLYAAELMADYGGPKAIVQFNKSIAAINKGKLAEAGIAMDAITLSALGMNTLPADYRRKIDGDKKVLNLLEQVSRTYLAKTYGFTEAEARDRSSFDARLAANRGRKPAIHAYNAASYEMRGVLNKALSIAVSTGTPLDDAGALANTFDYYDVELALPSSSRVLPADFVSGALTRVMQASKAAMLQRREAGFIDFDYWPSIGAPFCTFTKYELLFVDEAQDLSAANIELVRQSLSPTGRVVFVGDRAQAIYAWRGADTNSVSNIVARYGIGSEGLLPLSTCYRCDRSIVALAQAYVPAIQATPWAGEGSVEDIRTEVFDTLVATRKGPQTGDLVICRLNAPLGKFAMKIMRQPGLRVLVMGREDFYADLEKLYKPLAMAVERDGLPLSRFGVVIDQKLEARRAEFADLYDDDNDKIDKAMEKISDGYEFIRCVCDGILENGLPVQSVEQLTAYLFGPGGLIYKQESGVVQTLEELRKTRVVLASIHRAKGDEADTVWWIGPDLEGGKKKKPRPGEAEKPKKAWRVQEERNLKYVAITRPKHRLVRIAYDQ